MGVLRGGGGGGFTRKARIQKVYCLPAGKACRATDILKALKRELFTVPAKASPSPWVTSQKQTRQGHKVKYKHYTLATSVPPQNENDRKEERWGKRGRKIKTFMHHAHTSVTKLNQENLFPHNISTSVVGVQAMFTVTTV